MESTQFLIRMLPRTKNDKHPMINEFGYRAHYDVIVMFSEIALRWMS